MQPRTLSPDKYVTCNRMNFTRIEGCLKWEIEFAIGILASKYGYEITNVPLTANQSILLPLTKSKLFLGARAQLSCTRADRACLSDYFNEELKPKFQSKFDKVKMNCNSLMALLHRSLYQGQSASATFYQTN